jgi:cell filamentation protein, protein adenylyltransferase
VDETFEMTDVIPFSANFRRWTPDMLRHLTRIHEALGTIRGARVLPAVADQLRSSARVGTIHYSNLIEGNELPVIEAERAAKGQLTRDSRQEIELVNYVNALDLIDQRLADGSVALTTDFIKELHGEVTKGLGREDSPHFKPWHEGAWRDGVAIVYDHLSGRVQYEAPPPQEVPSRMEGLAEYLNNKLDQDPPFVVAGVAHYGITDVHPFADGNGRVARLFQAALLMKAQVLPGRMFSFERYYADDRDAYYAALRSVRAQTLNMQSWLEYFLEGLAQEYERVAATVEDLAQLTPGGNDVLQLSASQQRALADLRLSGRREFDRRDYEAAAGVGRTAATTDLRELVSHGLLSIRGAGYQTRYAFPGPMSSGSGRPRGRPRKWDDARIERELRAFLDGRSAWPTPAEFRAEGRADLYAAASRSGGIRRWRRFLGL